MGRHNFASRAAYPDSASVNCLLGKLYRAYDDKKKAIFCFEEALKANPLMWDAFTTLCDMGVNVRIPNIFKVSEALARGFDPEPNTLDLKDVSTSNPLEPIHKKSALQMVAQDSNDPFDPQRVASFHDIPNSNAFFSEAGENEFLSKIAAARSRLAANGGAGYDHDGADTPPNQQLALDAHASRSTLNQEPPQAPSRRPRPGAEPAFSDAPPRMSYRLGSKRRDKVQQDQTTDSVAGNSTSMLRGPPASVSTGERKRTVSGHPAQSRQTQVVEEPRRSARLNVFPRQTASKLNSGAATVGAAAGRELRRTRPPISRIMRPGSSGHSVGRVVSGNRKPVEENSMDVDQAELPRGKEAPPGQAPPQPPTKIPESDQSRIEEALRWILDLLRKIGSGYLFLSQFQCQEALAAYASLPRGHQDTPWVLAQMGRAQYELANYVEAEKFFRRLRILAPTRLEDMEVYSTILWHLKRETDLSFLAHELIEAEWHSPQAWCTLGNACSLAAEHEQALRCFKRATQLDPKFAYAYTLQGHEHVLNEEYDKALTSYRQAISADRRHYNAYYGIGKVYEKLGNYDKALNHFGTASVINPTNPVLICCVGTVLEKQKQIVQALQYFSKATDLAPRAAQTRYKKARALLAIGQLQAAQRELMILKDLAPDEPRVHFLLGKLSKTLRDKKSAVRHFTIALSLDPKASQQIKEAIEGLEEDDSLDDSMIQ
ncbi:hypothetical protein VTK73DRAFT_9770 [Phialemonium thermophilum]|uniref:Uncharacterized protein n=1 Tax=Phialemonium thermophilum TaxID=223376 RepID=A0ABR3XJH8_9PEZI